MTRRKLDIYALMVFLIILLLDGGDSIGGSLQPSRVGLALSFLLVWTFDFSRAAKPLRFLLYLAAVWLLWGMLSLVWAPDALVGAKQITGIVLGVLTAAITACLLCRSRAPWTAVRWGWVIAFMTTVPIALYEIITDHHLADSYGHIEAGGLETQTFVYAAVTFLNRNGYAGFICFAYPALICSYVQARRFSMRVFFLLLMLLAAGFVVLNASRTGMAVLVLETIICAWTNRKERLWELGAVVTLCVACVGVWIRDIAGQAAVRMLSLVSGYDQSTSIRWNLFHNGLALIANSWGFGIGAGGFEAEMARSDFGLDTGGIVNAHNVWVEVAAEYGLLILLAFSLWLLYCLYCIRKALKSSRSCTDDERQQLIYGNALLVSLPAIGVMNSNLITATMLWVVLGTLTYLAGSARSHPNARGECLELSPALGDGKRREVI